MVKPRCVVLWGDVYFGSPLGFHPGVPLKRIHLLCIFFTCPKIFHFHGPRSLPFDGVVRNFCGCCVVAVDWYFWLWMAKVLKGEFKNHPLLAI